MVVLIEREKSKRRDVEYMHEFLERPTLRGREPECQK